MSFLIHQGKKADNKEHWTIRQKDIRRNLKRKPSRSSGSPTTSIEAANQKTGNLTKEPESAEIKTSALYCGGSGIDCPDLCSYLFPYAQVNSQKISEIQDIIIYFLYLKFLLITPKSKFPMSKM